MENQWATLFDHFRPKIYSRRQPLILINGLAEQTESWFRNVRFWGRYFEVHAPNVLAYDGERIQNMIEARTPISIDYLVEQFHDYMSRYIQSPPYHLVSSSLGGKVAVELAVRYPKLISRVVLICPSGMGDEEKLPIMDGVRGDTYTLLRSVFHKPKFVDKDMLRFYRTQMQNRKWKTGLLRTVRGTMEYTVRDRLKDITVPTLLITGQHDKICDPKTAEEAARELQHGYFLALPKCGHAPQIEMHALINRLVVHFLTARKPSATPGWQQLMMVKPSNVPL